MADEGRIVLTGVKPLVRRCAWCKAEGKAPDEPDVEYTDGICPEHFRSMLFEDPLHSVIAALEGPEFLDRRRRAALAATLRQVVTRVQKVTIVRPVVESASCELKGDPS